MDANIYFLLCNLKWNVTKQLTSSLTMHAHTKHSHLALECAGNTIVRNGCVESVTGEQNSLAVMWHSPPAFLYVRSRQWWSS